MIGVILLVLAAICFLVAGFNQTFFEQGPQDLVAFGLLALTLATLYGHPFFDARLNRTR